MVGEVMDASTYQQQAARTLIDRPDFTMLDSEIMLLWTTFGLVGEAGEVVEVVKKAVFHRHPLQELKLRKEIGDVCWYLAGLCSVMQWDLSAIMAENIEKLKVRYPNGFSSSDSQTRVDVHE
jgi:NTP pyrophosphatase (non-canonical NTP hydrolase)